MYGRIRGNHVWFFLFRVVGLGCDGFSLLVYESSICNQNITLYNLSSRTAGLLSFIIIIIILLTFVSWWSLVMKLTSVYLKHNVYIFIQIFYFLCH